jgi:TolB-like protein
MEYVASLVRGEFAAGFYLNEPVYAEWMENERRRIAELSIAVLSRLLRNYEECSNNDSAILVAHKLLGFDPLQESIHRSLMRALALQDRYESALQQYKLCRDLFRSELGIDLSQETNELRDEIARWRNSGHHVRLAPEVQTRGLFGSLANYGTDKEKSVDLPHQLQGLELTIPERPSILIMPFDNLSNDPENDYLTQGIRIDIQAALVKITGIFVIAAGSANALAGKDSVAAGKALSVQYVLHGSLRKSGSMLRIATELIDVESGSAISTETYDREFVSGFAVQDEIIRRIITCLDVKLLHGEQAAVWHKTLKDIDSLECFYRGIQEFFSMNRDANIRARKHFEAVHQKQPDSGVGATWIALCHWIDAFKLWTPKPAQSLVEAGAWARKAVAKEDADGQAHMVLSHVQLMNRKFDEALITGREAIKLRPNCTNANGFFGNVLHYCGDQADAINHITWAIRYSPVYPPFFADVLALSLLFDDSTNQAISLAHESLRLNPDGDSARLVLIAGYNQTGQPTKSRKYAADLVQANPNFSVCRFATSRPYRNKIDINRFVDMITPSGLPQ